MGLFNIFKKKESDHSTDEDYKKYLQLMQDIKEGKVSEDLLNTDQTKKSLTTDDLALIVKYS